MAGGHVATTPLRLLPSATSRKLGLLGLASVGAILLGMVATAIPYRGHAGEGYSPLNHFVSELGEIAASRFALVFNLSLVLGGIGLGVFVLLLADRLSGRFRTILMAAGVVAGASGALVGVFPMDYPPAHRIVSGLFFLTGWLVACVFSLWLLSAPRLGFPRWLLVPGATAVAISVTFLAVFSTYHQTNPDGPILSRPTGFWSVPFLEWASLLSLLAWFVCVSIVRLRTPTE